MARDEAKTVTCPHDGATVRPMRIGQLVGIAVLAGIATGCASFNGPSVDLAAPRVTGRVVDDASGGPVRWARVGRKIWTWRKGTGEFLRGGEELLRMQDDARTDAEGRFTLPSKRFALLFSFGEVGLDLGLSVRHGSFHPWQTNYPATALSTNSTALSIDAGDVRLHRR